MHLRLLMVALAAALAIGTSEARAEVAERTLAPAATEYAGNLFVERFGTRGKPPIIVIPALFCGSWEWNRELPRLAQQYYVYAITLPGFDGRPAKPRSLGLAFAARDLHELIARDMRGARPIIVGHSLGGTLAVFFAESYPHDAAGIVAVEGGYPVAATLGERMQRAAAAAAPYERPLSPEQFGAALKARMLQYVITRPADVDAVERLAQRSQPSAVAGWLRAALPLDLTPELPRIVAPFVEIVPFDATIDPYTGHATLEAKRAEYAAWTARAKRGRTVMIDGARHFVMFDKPQEFDNALFGALAAMTPA